MKIFLGYFKDEPVFQQYKKGEKILSLQEAIDEISLSIVRAMQDASNDYDAEMRQSRDDDTMRPVRGF